MSVIARHTKNISAGSILHILKDFLFYTETLGLLKNVALLRTTISKQKLREGKDCLLLIFSSRCLRHRCHRCLPSSSTIFNNSSPLTLLYQLEPNLVLMFLGISCIELMWVNMFSMMRSICCQIFILIH